MTVATIKGPLACNDENFTGVQSVFTAIAERLRAVFELLKP
jgi:hypothetical protein